MRRSLLLALCCVATTALAQTPDALRAVTLPFGRVESAEHLTTPTLTLPDGQVRQGLPPRTVVKLLLQPAAGSNIRVELWLPEAAKWNGRLLGLGNGGAAGKINPGTLAGHCTAGYAAVTTDLGTAPNPDSGIGNREVWKDFGFRATHLMTLAAKQLVQTHYGRPAEFSYFLGGSTGGQQALQAAQRYPEDYDGIIAQIPAHCRTPLHAYFLWNHQILQRTPFTAAQEAGVIRAAVEHFAPRELPVAAGKFISDPRATAEDIEAVIARALRQDTTLTPAHAEALRQLFTGPRQATTGHRLFGGIPLGSSLSLAHSHLYLFRWVFGADKPLEQINFGSDLDTYTAALAPYLNAENADLTAFQKRGGKLLMTSGTADSIVPYHATLDYYERVIQHHGGDLPAVQSYFRFYLIPGMGHSGGPGLNQPPNLLEPLRAWREQGRAPTTLTARRVVEGQLEFELPLYPYPQRTAWNAITRTYEPAPAPRGGVDRVHESFRPAAQE